MIESKQTSALTAERKLTDGSLKAERGKTDETFETFRSKMESETDETLKHSRFSSDRARLERQGTTESSIENRAIHNERADADHAIEREREAKDAMVNALLNIERGETDLNLAFERTQSDKNSETSATKLIKEEREHTGTKEALTTREEYMAIVSHDLRNPIGVILSCSEVILEDSNFSKIDDETRNWVQLIKRNAETSLRLITDLLDMERIAEGKLELRLESHNVNKLVQDLIQNFSHEAASKTVLLKASLPKEALQIKCDRDRIVQVLSNLIGNSLKFTPEGGTIVVKAEAHGDYITLTIKDTGIGIPFEKQSIIFDRFAQLHKQDRRGLGLGLFISKKLVEAHRGRIEVSSIVGAGSQFSIILPIN